MELNIPYRDLTSIIERKTGKNVSFTCLGERTLKIGYDIKVPIFGTRQISTELAVEGIVDNNIRLRFEKGASMIISGLLHFFKGVDFVESTDELIVLHLDKIEQARGILKTIALKDIAFLEDNMTVSADIL